MTHRCAMSTSEHATRARESPLAVVDSWRERKKEKEKPGRQPMFACACVCVRERQKERVGNEVTAPTRWRWVPFRFSLTLGGAFTPLPANVLARGSPSLCFYCVTVLILTYNQAGTAPFTIGTFSVVRCVGARTIMANPGACLQFRRFYSRRVPTRRSQGMSYSACDDRKYTCCRIYKKCVPTIFVTGSTHARTYKHPRREVNSLGNS